MFNPVPAASLEVRRADLRHFEETGDFGENQTVSEIKTHLLRRIAEIESALRRTNPLDSVVPWVSPEHSNRR
jgi:hypothetical protein